MTLAPANAAAFSHARAFMRYHGISDKLAHSTSFIRAQEQPMANVVEISQLKKFYQKDAERVEVLQGMNQIGRAHV